MQCLGLSAWLAVAVAASAAATPAVVPPDAAGRWQGTIHVPGADVEAVVDLARTTASRGSGRWWLRRSRSRALR